MFVDIKRKAELADRVEDIAALFLSSYGKPISKEEWRWFYIDNPVGDPYVSLFYEAGRLIGHYAVIPTLLKMEGQSFVGYRSMTTMVDPVGRGRGLFTQLANRVYALLQDDAAALVYGFPNKNSAPGFIRNLGWSLIEPDSIYDVSGVEIHGNSALAEILLASGDIKWDSDSPVQLAWRITSPTSKIYHRDGLLIKEFDDRLNILHIDKQGLDHIDENCYYRIMIPSIASMHVKGTQAVFDYQFGYRIFDERYLDKSIRRELVMSDIF